MTHRFLVIATLLVSTAGIISLTNLPASAKQGMQSINSEDTKTETQTPDIDLVKTGKNAFRQCSICHTTTKDGRNKIGPNLYAIVGQEAASRDGFNYSKAMAKSGIIWTEDNLDQFINNPRALVPNNRMAFGGVKNAEQRAAIIAYLKSLGSE